MVNFIICASLAIQSISSINNMTIFSNAINLKDFNGNTFYLLEQDSTYSIYDSNGVFIEGSLNSNSPYSNSPLEKYYLGPGNYYLAKDEVVYDIFSKKYSSISDYDGLEFCLPDTSAANQNSTSSEIVTNGLTLESYRDSNGFAVIRRAKYFKDLIDFPNNYFGTCGLVALSILLGYYDTFYNDDFLINDKEFLASYYNDDGSLYYTHWEPFVKKSLTALTPYLISDYETWDIMPGTNQSLHDYLFKNYMSAYHFPGVEGYAMLDEDLAQTIYDYMFDNCRYLLDDTVFRNGTQPFVEDRARTYIELGQPVCLVLINYTADDPGINFGKYHTVVAYRFKDDKFLTHFGWNPGFDAKNQVILNSSTIFGYFTMTYNGEHKCSKNVMMSDGKTVKYVCGCGIVFDEQ